jgi:hypothetical protein
MRGRRERERERRQSKLTASTVKRRKAKNVIVVRGESTKGRDGPRRTKTGRSRPKQAKPRSMKRLKETRMQIKRRSSGKVSAFVELSVRKITTRRPDGRMKSGGRRVSAMVSEFEIY